MKPLISGGYKDLDGTKQAGLNPNYSDLHYLQSVLQQCIEATSEDKPKNYSWYRVCTLTSLSQLSRMAPILWALQWLPIDIQVQFKMLD